MSVIYTVLLQFYQSLTVTKSEEFSTEVYHGHHYIFRDTMVTPALAEQRCVRRLGHLAWIMSPEENAWLLAQQPQQGVTKYIIGLNHSGENPLQYVWTSGDAAEFLLLEGEAADTEEVQPQHGLCFALSFSPDMPMWQAIACDQSLAFICKIPEQTEVVLLNQTADRTAESRDYADVSVMTPGVSQVHLTSRETTTDQYPLHEAQGEPQISVDTMDPRSQEELTVAENPDQVNLKNVQIGDNIDREQVTVNESDPFHQEQVTVGDESDQLNLKYVQLGDNPDLVNRENITVVDESDLVNRENITVVDESDQVNRENITVVDESDIVKRENITVVDESDLVNRENITVVDESDLVNRENITVVDESDLVNRENITVVDESDQVNRENITVGDESDIVNRENITVVDESDLVNRENITVVDESDQVNRENITVIDESDQVNRENITVGDESDIVNRENITVVDESDLVNRENITVVDESDQVNRENITVIDESDQVNRENITVGDESDIVNRENITVVDESDLVNRENITVVDESDLVNRENITVVDESDLVNRENITVVDESDLVNRENITVVDESDQVNRENITVGDESDIVNRENITVVDESDLVNRENITVVDESDVVNRENITVVDESDLVNRENITVVDESDLVNRENITVVDKSDQVNRENITVVDESDQVNRENITVVDESDIVNRENITVVDESDIVNRENITVVDESDIVNRENITVVDESDIVNSENITVVDESDLVNRENITVVDESDLVNRENITVVDESDIVNRENITVVDESVVVNRENITVGDESDLVNRENITVVDESDLVNRENITVVDESDLLDIVNREHVTVETTDLSNQEEEEAVEFPRYAIPEDSTTEYSLANLETLDTTTEECIGSSNQDEEATDSLTVTEDVLYFKDSEGEDIVTTLNETGQTSDSMETLTVTEEAFSSVGDDEDILYSTDSEEEDIVTTLNETEQTSDSMETLTVTEEAFSSVGDDEDVYYSPDSEGEDIVSLLSETGQTTDWSSSPAPCEVSVGEGVGGAGMTSESPEVYLRSHIITLETEVSVDCGQQPQQVSLSYNWTLYRCLNPTDSDCRSTGEPVTSSSAGVNTSQLTIPDHTLAYGNYAVQVQTVAGGGAVLVGEGTSVGWFRVIELPLQPNLTTQTDAVGLQETVSLDASGSWDAEDDPAEIEFTWVCHTQRETLPDSLVMVQQSAGDFGGCFGSGHILSETGSTYQAAAIHLLFENLPTTYTFRVYLSKPGRTSVFTSQTVTLVTVLPVVEITCVENCGTYLDTTARAILQGDCSNCVEGEMLTYLWHFSPAAELVDHLSLDWENDTDTGQYNQSLVLRGDLFPSNVSTNYTFNVTVTRSDQSVGSSSHTLFVNKPPSPGLCAVSPTEGAVLQTQFVVTCSNFTDPDLPLSYSMYTVDGSNSHLMYSGPNSSSPALFLAEGPESHNYTHTVQVQVADAYGGSVTVVTSVKVTPAQIDTQDLLALTTGQSSALDDLVTSGDGQATTQFIDTVSSVLNAQSAGGDSGGQDERTQVRDSLVQSLVQVEVQSMDNLQQSTAALTQVTSVATELSPAAQSSASQALLQTADFLSSQTNTTSEGDLQAGGELLVSGISNVMEAAVLTNTQDTEGGSPGETENRNVTLTCLLALDEVKDTLLKNKQPGDSATVISSDSLCVNLRKELAQDIAGSEYEVQGTFSGETPRLAFPQSLVVGGVGDEVDTEFVSFKTNPFVWSASSSEVTTAVSQVVFKVNQLEVLVEDLSEPISIYVPQSESGLGEFSEATVSSEQTAFLEFTKTGAVETVMIELKVDDSADVSGREDVVIQLGVYAGVTGGTDTAGESSSAEVTDLSTQEPLHLLEVTVGEFPHVEQLGPGVLESGGTYVLMLTADIPSNVPLMARISQTKCLYWNKTQEIWTHQGCQLGAGSRASLLHCQCTHLTSFGGGMLVMPNKLNLKEDVKMFLSFWQNPIGIIAVCSVLGVYIFLAVWARRKDKLDEIKALPIDLMDNDPDAEYRLLVTVYTGSRRGAGTSAKVCILINGNDGASEPHLLECREYPALQRGDTSFFLVRTRGPLGDILSVRLWHNNAGTHPAWFVSRMLVYDPQTNKSHYFVCNCWLAVDLGDGILDQTFNVASKEDIEQFEHLFFTNANSGLCDKHLWFSVAVRPAFSTFTRVQRLSCCLSLVLAYMLTNIMFYGIDKQPGEQEMDVGPFSLSWTEMRIGFQSMLLMVPVNLLIVWLFRNIRPRHDRHTLHEKLTFDINGAVEGVKSHVLVTGSKTKSQMSIESVSQSVESHHMETKYTLYGKDEVKDTHGEGQFKEHIMIRQDSREMPPTERLSSMHHADWGPSIVSLFMDSSSSHVGTGGPRRDTAAEPPPHSQQVLYTQHGNTAGYRSSGGRGGEQEQLTEMEQGFESFASILTTADSWSSHQDESVSEEQTLISQEEIKGLNKNNSNRETIGSGKSECPNDGMDSDQQVTASSSAQHEEARNTSNGVAVDKIPGRDVRDTSRSRVVSESSNVSLSGIEASFQSVIQERMSYWSTTSGAHIAGQVIYDSSGEESVETDTAVVDVTSELMEETVSEEVVDKRRCSCRLLPLPWWCVVFAWLLLATVSFICGFFTILYTFNYGLDKSFQWLRSLIGCFLGDVLVEQPLKVVAIALFFSLVIKRSDTEDVDVRVTSEDREDLNPELMQTWRQYLEYVKREATYKPPPQISVTAARKRREVERKMYAVLSEILRYAMFMYLVTLLAYSQRDNNLYPLNKLTKGALLSPRTSAGLHLEEMAHITQLWTWIEEVSLVSLYGAPDAGSVGFMEGRGFVGRPVLRQHRVRRVGCEDVHKLLYTGHCWQGYKPATRETGAFSEGWREGGSGQSAWTYSGSQDYTKVAGKLSSYDSGGYIADLGGTLSEANQTIQALRSGDWMDEGTAAVVLEFIFYSPNLNLATSVQVLFEFPSYGGILKQASIYSMRLYRSAHGFHIFVLVFELVYLLWTLYFIVHEVKALRTLKLKYFSNAGCVLDLCGCVLSVIVIGLYITHIVQVNELTKAFKSGRTVYKSFGKVALLDGWITYTLSFIVVIGMLKFLHLLRFNPLIYKFMCILKYGCSKLAAIGAIILVLIGGFGHMMYLAAGKQLVIFSSLRLALLKLFVNLLGKLSSDQFESYSDVVIGPAFMVGFILLLTVFLFNMMIVVLMEAMEYVKECPQPLEEAEMLWLLLDKFVQWLGIRRTHKKTRE